MRDPHLVATAFDGRESPHVFVVDEVEVNMTLDDGVFLKTEWKLAAVPARIQKLLVTVADPGRRW